MSAVKTVICIDHFLITDFEIMVCKRTAVIIVHILFSCIDVSNAVSGALKNS